MLSKACGACFTVALVLAALAFAAAELNQGREQSSAALDLLTTIFIVASVVFLILCMLFGGLFVAVWIWRYFHAVEITAGQWYCRYWPLQRIAQVSGVVIKCRDWAGTLKVSCHAQFVKEEVRWATALGGNGSLVVEFPQQAVAFASDPKEGDPAIIVIRAEPSWWRGRPSQRIQRINIGITDHRQAVTPDQVRDAIARIDSLVGEAQRILDSCGRPREQMQGADPMHFQNFCIPRIIKFGSDAATTINEVAPEYIGKLQNVGNVTHNTDVKPAMIQELEKWLENLGAIQDELRKRL